MHHERCDKNRQTPISSIKNPRINSAVPRPEPRNELWIVAMAIPAITRIIPSTPRTMTCVLSSLPNSFNAFTSSHCIEPV